MELVINETRLSIKQMRPPNLTEFKSMSCKLKESSQPDEQESKISKIQAGRRSRSKKTKQQDPVEWILGCYMAQQWGDILTTLNEELPKKDGNPALLWLRADVKARTGNPQGGCVDLQDAIAQAPGNVHILFTWAEMLRVPLERPQEAVMVYGLIEQFSSLDAAAHVCHARASVHIHLQQYKAAEHELAKCLRNEWNGSELLPGIHQDLAQMMIVNRKYTAACETLKGAARSGSSPDEICVDLATALYGLGRKAEALQKLSHARRCNPSNATALKNLATVKGAMGDWTGCVEDMKACILLQPHNPLLKRRLIDLIEFGKVVAGQGLGTNIMELLRDWDTIDIPDMPGPVALQLF